MCRLVLLVALLVISANADKEADEQAHEQALIKGAASRAKGWGNAIAWEASYEEALMKAKTKNKPLMVIHHREECKHSKALKKVFAVDKTIQNMAKEFIMLNLVEEPMDKNMALDGYYVPRILFVDPDLRVLAHIKGPYSNAQYVYEPADLKLLADNMKRAKMKHTEL
ncbi:anterior gradient protein 2 homolog [Neosynchiropus ocellatus]